MSARFTIVRLRIASACYCWPRQHIVGLCCSDTTITMRMPFLIGSAVNRSSVVLSATGIRTLVVISSARLIAGVAGRMQVDFQCAEHEVMNVDKEFEKRRMFFDYSCFLFVAVSVGVSKGVWFLVE